MKRRALAVTISPDEPTRVVGCGPGTSHPLYLELGKCGVPDDAIQKVVDGLRLFRPVWKTVRDPLDENMYAQFFLAVNGRPDPEAKWASLSYAERLRAKRTWRSFGQDRVQHRRAKQTPTSIGPSRAGRPTRIDPALVLYCVRVLCEASGSADFPLSRDSVEGVPTGPMWRALVSIFPLMQSYVAIRSNMAPIAPNTISRHAEAIAGDVKLAKSKIFQDWCEKLGLGPRAEDVVISADTFRHAFAIARKARRDKKWTT
jgi:hypothetical protein